ncbi:hypothetical protein G9P44_001285 [Scheffersomyces stipitis]|nr:hypothetical protein G9P44_001285 [Scheffersomyces stipitis]
MIDLHHKPWKVMVVALLALLAMVIGADTQFEPKVTSRHEKSVARSIKFFDDSSNILVLRNEALSISFDDGVNFQDVQESKGDNIMQTEFDPFFPERAFAFTRTSSMYFTVNKGKDWTKVKLEHSSGYEISSYPNIHYNAKNINVLLISFRECEVKAGNCREKFFYTEDGLKSLKPLPIEANICKFVHASKEIDVGSDNALLCSVNTLNSFGHIVESKLLKSDDFFKNAKELHSHFTKTGSIIAIAVESNFIVVVIQNDKFSVFSKVSLLTSKDAENFHLSDLKVDFAYGIMQFLDSSPSSMFLAVMKAENHRFSAATLYASDSRGAGFEKVLEDVQDGAVKKVQTVDGAWLANVLSEASSDDAEDDLVDIIISGGSKRIIQSKFTFNDGKDWDLLKVNEDDCKISDGCSLHLLTPAERDGEGKFVTGPTPAILLAVGSKGKSLAKHMNKMQTWISRDGGATWKKAIDEPCVFIFGDQGNVILAIPYAEKGGKSTSKYYYTLDQGSSWVEGHLEFPIYPLTLTTTTDGTSTKFIASGLYDETPDNQHDVDFSEVFYTFDFSAAFGGNQCADSDFEEVYARVTDDNNPVCVYGHKEKFKRRKQDAKCFVNKLFEDVKVYDDPCECGERDFECSRGFMISQKGNTCIPNPRAIRHICRQEGKKELSLPDKALIDGDKCSMNKKSTKDFVSDVKLKCSDYLNGNGDGGNTKPGGDSKDEVVTTFLEFEGEMKSYSYVEYADEENKYKSENIVLRTSDKRVYVSNNGGVSFNKVPIADNIIAYYVGYVQGQVVLVTDTDIIYLSDDGGSTFKKTAVPNKAVLHSRAISFHKTNKNMFIWYGSDNCDVDSPDCDYFSYITKDGGSTFNQLKDKVVQCDFISPFLESKEHSGDDLVFCSVLDRSSGKLSLQGSDDYFQSSLTLFDHIVGYAITGNFVVVATVTVKDGKSELEAKVTIDGSQFAAADFPSDFHVDSKQAYTILDSQSKAIFMHVTTNSRENEEYGSILKSNSNGTSYVLSIEKVNRNRVGYVDYDRIDGLEGVIIANVVGAEKDTNKKLKTMITHNDGGEWSLLTPPVTNSLGNKYPCTNQPLDRCSLHLHGFTERPDYRDTFSSSSATGLLIGVGSVGASLDSYEQSSTFMSNDGGITWKEIQQGVFMWEYGDRGTIIVLVDAKETDTLLYSLDDGETWVKYKFAEKPVIIDDLATVPSDTSRKFLIFARASGDTKSTIAYSIDFTNAHRRQCQLDLDNPANDDFDYWSPRHPLLPNDCLFGHESKYLRRAKGHNDCFIGSAPLTQGFKVTRNCSCTRRDFECDYNFYRDTDNTCKLVKGLSPTDRKNDYCKKENAFEYFEPTGYRKIPLSTCIGGKEFDTWDSRPCPGKEKEYNIHYGKEISSGKFLLLVLVPLFVFCFATWFVYDRGIRRNGGFKRFGQIRLDLDDDEFHPIEDNQVDVVVNRIVRGGIYTVAGLYAVFKTLRTVDRMLLDRVASVVFRRSPGRRNYVQVPDIDEEDELFGDFQDDYEEEIEEGANIAQDFRDNEDDIAGLENEETPQDVDERLFNIDEHSDEEPLVQQ